MLLHNSWGNYRDPSKFDVNNFGGAGSSSDYIPGESDRDRRLRLRAMEKKARLNSAKSNISSVSNTQPSSLPSAKSYQENVKFPENTEIISSLAKPAIEKELPLFRNQFNQPRFEEVQYSKPKFDANQFGKASYEGNKFYEQNKYDYDIEIDNKPISASTS